MALRGQWLAGVVACSLAAEVKAPALVAVVFIGWWAASARSPARPARPPLAWRVLGALAALVLALLLIAAMSAVAGLGWGFVGTMLAPERVVSWLDPATAAGLSLSHLVSLLGLGVHRAGLVDVARVVGICAAAAIGVLLLLRSDRETAPEALGWTMLALALLGPVVWPWYETWGLVLLGSAAVTGWRRGVLVVLSGIGCVADVPSSSYLVDGSPVLVAFLWGVLAVMLAGTVSVALRSRPARLL